MALSLAEGKLSCSPEERQRRIDLAALYRLFVHYGWTDLIYTHISARVPGEEGHYLINPYGLLFDEIRASDLIKVDYNGNVIAGDYPFNEAGHLIHTAVLKARPDVEFVLHSHTRAGMAVSAMPEGLQPLTQHAGLILSQVSYHDFQDVTTAEDECHLLARDLGDKNLMIMRNHGLLACGRTAGEAFTFHYFLEMSCKVQVDILGATDKPVILAPSAVESLTRHNEEDSEPRGEDVWTAMIRMLDRKDPSYKD